MRELLRVMKAMSDPSRIKILKMLQRKVMCVCEIQTVLGTAQSTASKHLQILEKAGLLTSYKDGLWVNYHLADGSTPYAASLLGNLRHWLEDEPEIVEIVEKLHVVERKNIYKK